MTGVNVTPVQPSAYEYTCNTRVHIGPHLIFLKTNDIQSVPICYTSRIVPLCRTPNVHREEERRREDLKKDRRCK